MHGTIYLLHFDAPGLHVTGNRYARHYLGWSGPGNLDGRLAHHRAGQGSRLVRGVLDAGLDFELARVWHGEDRHLERELKRRRNTPALCPLCAIERGRGGFALGPRRDRLDRHELAVIRDAIDRRRRLAALSITLLTTLSTTPDLAVVNRPGPLMNRDIDRAMNRAQAA